jgi:hypothetical protein
MMLLAATTPAPVHGPTFMINGSRRNRLDWFCSARPAGESTRSVFYSPVANLLESQRGGSHYSVIDCAVATPLVPGLSGSYLLIDEISASLERDDTADAQAQAGEE